jgi:hypothetical protein
MFAYISPYPALSSPGRECHSIGRSACTEALKSSFHTHTQLAKRAERREAAEVELAKAQEAGDEEGVDKFSRRLVKATKQHSEDCKTLLTLMGVPYFEVRACPK